MRTGALYTLPNHPTIKRRGELQSIVQQLAIKQSRTILSSCNASYLYHFLNFVLLCVAPSPRIFLRPNYLQQGTVGEPHDLVCSITLSSMIQTDSVYLAWNFVINDTRVRVIPAIVTTDDSSDIIYTTVIEFDYLTELDEGCYTCLLRLENDSTISTFYLDTIGTYVRSYMHA